MHRSLIRILPLLLSALACSALQSFSAPEPVWTYSNESIHNNGFDLLLHVDESGNVYTYLASDGFSVDGLLGLNGVTGQELWSPVVNEEIAIFYGIDKNHAFFRSPFTDETNSDGNVLFSVIVYDLQTSSEAWRFTGIPENYPVIPVEGYVYAWKSSTELFILDSQNGEVISTYTQNDIDPSEYTDLNAGWVDYLYTETSFYSLSPAGVLREYSLPNATLTHSITLDVPYYVDTYIIEDGILYLYAGYTIGSDASLLAYDLTSGQKLWEVLGMYGTSREIQFQNGLGYLNTSQGASALNLETGEVLWSTGGSLYGPFLVNEETNGKLLVVQDNSLAAYDAVNGEKAWAFEPGLENTLQLTAVDGTAFVTSGDDPPAFQSGIIPSRLDAINIENGKSVWRVEHAWITLPQPAGAFVIAAYEKGISAYPLK
ncbi:MAG: hypothetical protein RIR73_1219 [Chloroflexota bacterium]